MDHADSPHETMQCVWMAAGLVTYKLCDRDYDCEHCPFDAALRGVPLPVSERRLPPDARLAATHGPRPIEFPGDRRYGDGHTWVGVHPTGDPVRRRVGLDGFAWSILDRPRAIRAAEPGTILDDGVAMCELDLDVGLISVAAPCRGAVRRRNEFRNGEIEAPAVDPYGAGWLVELDAHDGASDDRLVDARQARRRTGHDLQRLGRQVALAMLAFDRRGIGATLPDGGELVTNLRGLLGAPRYLELLREFIH